MTASDGTASVSDTFDIVVSAAANNAPTARAGGDRTVEPGSTVTLSGSGTDSDGTIASYAWSQISGTNVTLNNANTARASFTAPDTAGTVLEFRLTVTDDAGATGTDEVTITVRDGPPRFAGAVPTLQLEPGEPMTPVVLPAATGGNGGPYEYTLSSVPSGLAGLDFSESSRTLSGTPNVERGSWTFTYTAHDGDGNRAASDAARLTFRVTVGMAPEVQRRAVKRSLVALATGTMASALDTVGARLGDGVSGASLTLAGETVPLDASGSAPATVSATEARLEAEPVPGGRAVDADTLLSASSFSLPLGAAEGDPGFDPDAPRWSVWGRGDLGQFAGRPEPGMHYRGGTRTGWLGVDARGSGGSGLWVAGLAVSHGTGKADYGFEGGADPSERGRLETKLSALWPYWQWTFGNGLELRGMLGAGTGSLRHVPGGGESEEESKLSMRAASLGIKRKLEPLAGFDMAARGDASFVRVKTAGGEQTIDGLRADGWRVRAGVEASRRHEAGDGRSFTPFLELAVRQDGGDGLTGTGLEVAGGLRHRAPGIDVELRGRWLAAHTRGGAEESGVSLTVRMLPKEHGRGLSMSLSSRGGAGTGGADALWHEELPKVTPVAEAHPSGRLEGEIGYGFAAFGGRFTATPNAGFSRANGGGGDWRIGWRLASAVWNDPGLEVSLDATRSVAANGAAPAEHGVMLNATVRW